MNESIAIHYIVTHHIVRYEVTVWLSAGNCSQIACDR